MGDETINVTNASDAQALAELEAEFQRELERNSAALELLKERAEEAKCAKTRADLTAQKMECMKFKYLDIQEKMERSRKLLQNAQDRIERQEQVRRTVANLRQKADLYQSKLNMQKLLKESGGAMPDSECGGMPDIEGCSGFDFPEPIINYEEEERQENDEEATKSGSKIDYARTVLDLQEKLSRVQAPTLQQSSTASQLPSSSAKAAENDHEEISEEVEDALAIKLEETVHSLEAKCAGVREELGRMALSEQYMRTKQAQLKAKKKEKEAEEAAKRAAQKELEAAEMRQKVGNMMKLLAERKNKLKSTENVIEKKGVVVEKVTKLLDSKQRKETFVSNKKEELLAFDKAGKK